MKEFPSQRRSLKNKQLYMMWPLNNTVERTYPSLETRKPPSILTEWNNSIVLYTQNYHDLVRGEQVEQESDEKVDTEKVRKTTRRSIDDFHITVKRHLLRDPKGPWLGQCLLLLRKRLNQYAELTAKASLKIIAFSNYFYSLKHFAEKLKKPFICSSTPTTKRHKMLRKFRKHPKF
jgi:hypothetical protein